MSGAELNLSCSKLDILRLKKILIIQVGLRGDRE